MNRDYIPNFGIPYGRAGNIGRKSTVTCPKCNEVFVALGPKQAAQKYAVHYEKEHVND